MVLKVFVHDRPHRTLALVTDDHALIFRHTYSGTEQGIGTSVSSLNAPTGGRQGSPPRCLVEFSPRSSLDLKSYRSLATAKGTVGLITLNNDVFICVITGSAEVATVRPGETVQNIFAVEFCKCLSPIRLAFSNRRWQTASTVLTMTLVMVQN